MSRMNWLWLTVEVLIGGGSIALLAAGGSWGWAISAVDGCFSAGFILGVAYADGKPIPPSHSEDAI